MSISAERARLHDAIADETRAHQAVDEARRAAHHTQSKWSAANQKVGALTAQIEEAEEAPSSSDRFIAELAGGLDVVVENHVDELRKARDKAEIESAIWNAARATSEEAIEARMAALDLARSRVDAAARIVADAELRIDALLARAETARQATLVATAELMTVMRLLPQASMRRREIESFLQIGWCAPNMIERVSGGVELREWFAKLCADASAKMMS